MINLSIPTDRIKLEELILADIDAYCLKVYEQGFRSHLGASIMGEKCARKLYYTFRWMKQEDFDGRMMRLFNVGHSAEPRFIDYLRGIGFEVKEFDDNGKQFRISGCKGHYGGSLDGLAKAPLKYNLTEDLILSVEFKTNGTGAGFNNIANQHLSKAKPSHWAQACQYGYKRQIKYCLYLIENKNDSSIIVKVIELDWAYGKSLEKLAEEIIFAEKPPAKISENPAFQICKWCTFSDICHEGELPVINCRSCKNSEPVDNGKWFCHKYQNTIPENFIAKGCSEHVNCNN